MVLIEWSEARKFIYAALCLIPSAVLFLNARRRTNKLIPLLSLVPTLLSCSLLVLWGLGLNGANYNVPAVYSLDGKFAARTSVGPFGDQVVALFSWYGLRKQVLYRGYIDDERHLRWIGHHTLEIPTRNSSEKCTDTSEVMTICAPKNTRL